MPIEVSIFCHLGSLLLCQVEMENGDKCDIFTEEILECSSTDAKLPLG